VHHRRTRSPQHALSRSAPGSGRSRYRGSGRPCLLTGAAAAVLLIAAVVATGVIPGPTPAAGADRLALASDSGHGLTGSAAVHDWPTRPHAGRSAVVRPSHRAPADGRARSRTATRPSPSPSPSASAAPDGPYLIYDSATPAAIPPGVLCATYATGGFAVPAAEMAGRPTIWIDAWGTDPAASVLDVEPGDATPSMVPAWVTQHLALEPADNARIYTMLDEWSAVQQAVATLPAWMQARIRWWIADPTGVPHMVPGASATQWYWGPGYDISTAEPNF